MQLFPYTSQGRMDVNTFTRRRPGSWQLLERDVLQVINFALKGHSDRIAINSGFLGVSLFIRIVSGRNWGEFRMLLKASGGKQGVKAYFIYIINIAWKRVRANDTWSRWGTMYPRSRSKHMASRPSVMGSGGNRHRESRAHAKDDQKDGWVYDAYDEQPLELGGDKIWKMGDR